MSKDQAIKTKLDLLASFRAQTTVLQLEKQKLIDAVLTNEQRARLAHIDEEFADKFDAAKENETKLQDQIKEAVRNHGESVKGTFLHAVYSLRTSYDQKRIKLLAQSDPSLIKKKSEVVAFRNV